MTAPVLRLEGITKTFGALTANDDISLALEGGEVLALLGENGAGKTTLMNILFGHYRADRGRVFAFGHELPPGAPRAAIAAGIGMVHQHFALAPNLRVIDNVVAGTESFRSWRSDGAGARRRLRDLSDRFGLAVDPDALVADLSVGERQRVEILKPLYRGARVLILDEPTAVLTQQESDTLFATLKKMTTEGLSIIFISHKLPEVMRSADRVVVLRGGKVVAERATSETSADELAELMVGRRVSRPVRASQTPGPIVMAGRDVGWTHDGQRLITGANFEVRAGETLGVIGVSGNGQSQLLQLACGLATPTEGQLTLAGNVIHVATARAFVEAGVGRVPEDRHAQGAVADLAVWENVVLDRLGDPRFARAGFVRRTAARAFAKEVIEGFDVRGGTPDTLTRLLSGGNMQKLILGRNLIASPMLLVAGQPTRGLDEGAVAVVHGHILGARREGMAVLLVSEDLDEILGLADRVQAMVKGRLSPPRPVEGLDARQLGRMMSGLWDEAA